MYQKYLGSFSKVLLENDGDQLKRSCEKWRNIKLYRAWRIQEFFSGGGDSTNSVEDRGQIERGSGGSNPLVRGSGDSCNLVQEISFHIVKFS